MPQVDSGHAAVLRALGVSEARLAPLEAYLDLLATWSARTNLTAARTAEARVRVLVAPALKLAPFLAAGSLLDVGSGNGSPGLVLALLDPARQATLLEPRARRWAFLREVARTCGRPDITIVRARHDQYEGAPVANVTLRALRLPTAAILPLLHEGGRLLVLGPHAPSPPDPGLAEVPGLPAGVRVFARIASVPRET